MAGRQAELTLRAKAKKRGITDSQLRGTGYQRVLRGVYIAAGEAVPDTVTRARAALALSPVGSAASHHTAAELWGGVVPDTPHTHVTVPGSQRSRVDGVASHRRRHPVTVTTRLGVRVTSPAQTFLDLAMVLGLLDLVVLGDSLVRQGRVSPDELVAAAQASCARGSGLARRAAGLVRKGVDSPPETRLRLLLVLAGLPEPTVNLCLRDDAGEVIYRLDLAWEEWKAAVEYDGRQHAESDKQWLRDIGRREDFDSWGWRLVVVVARDLYNRPDLVLERTVRILQEQGVRGLRLTDGWRRWFPVRQGIVQN
jgi:hypothetical protein